MPKKQTFDEYLAALSADKHTALEKLRKAIRAAAPKAEECICYGVPAFRLNGKFLVGLAAAANHCSFYPGSAVQNFKAKLKGYEISKGTVRFQPDKPLPSALVRKLVKARIEKGGFIALVLSGGLFVFGNAAGSLPIRDEPQPKQPVHALEFDSIHMIDRQNGWAQNARGVFRNNHWVFKDKAIWRTTDGGKSWRHVLCASTAETGNVSAFFRDSKTAWVAAAGESTNVTIFRTKDGGRSWVWSRLNQSEILQDCCLSCPSRDEGWLMLIPEHGMNSSPGVLYRTSDGGANWQQVNRTGGSFKGDIYEGPEFEGRHPYPLCGGAIAFRNASRGWLLGSMASTAPQFLFETTDAGRNWKLRTLPLPSNFHDGEVRPRGLPQFFPAGGKEGIIASEFFPGENNTNGEARTLIYLTHDGGRNWKATTPVKNYCVWNFISARKGWIWSAETHSSNSTAPVRGTLYRTSDGGVSWKVAGTGRSMEQYLTDGENIVQLDFVDGQYGWAIARDGHNLTQLLHTNDGGETWRAIQASVAP
jgi:uncharacterized protein YdhG (YjbR/CyaY superfamily)/photosystem II stability/assembly factor-like uncharacterized protein